MQIVGPRTAGTLRYNPCHAAQGLSSLISTRKVSGGSGKVLDLAAS